MTTDDRIATLVARMTTAEKIAVKCDGIRDMLVEKNQKYGDSALFPLRVFSRGDADEAIRTRIDDKLSRIHAGVLDDEDTILDLVGYLVLLLISRDRQENP
jgi:hypothetical protein